MMYLAIPDRIGAALSRELLDAAPLESGAFCRLYEYGTGNSARLVLGAPIGSAEPWAEQEVARLTPSGRRISAAISIASTERCGLAFVHSHPSGPASLSRIDRVTTERLAAVMGDVID